MLLHIQSTEQFTILHFFVLCKFVLCTRESHVIVTLVFVFSYVFISKDVFVRFQLCFHFKGCICFHLISLHLYFLGLILQ